MILVFGQTGQVATELVRDASVRALGRADLDLMQPARAAEAIADLRPTAVINAAAYTAVDAAEQDEAAAHVLNAEAPGVMARAAARLDVPFIHISTDYVFNGSGQTPWRPDDPIAPLGAYGRTKAAGEDAVRAAGGTHAILRTSWVFSAHGSNFVKTMLRLGEERDHLRVVADQVGGPTPATGIACACLTVARMLAQGKGEPGTYHFTGAPDVSWADFARAIFKTAGLTCQVEDIPTSAYPTPASRPANSRLDCDLIQQVFGIYRPDWQMGLKDVLTQLEAVADD